MDSEENPRYTAYTEEEIKAIERTSQEIGRLEGERRRLKEKLFNLKTQMAHNEIGGMTRWN